MNSIQSLLSYAHCVPERKQMRFQNQTDVEAVMYEPSRRRSQGQPIDAQSRLVISSPRTNTLPGTSRPSRLLSLRPSHLDQTTRTQRLESCHFSPLPPSPLDTLPGTTYHEPRQPLVLKMDLNSLKDTVSNLSLYDLKAGVRKVQNGKQGVAAPTMLTLWGLTTGGYSCHELHRNGGQGIPIHSSWPRGYISNRLDRCARQRTTSLGELRRR